jgi:anti-sigma factor RsiW
MMHWRARRLLPALPDGTLERRTELELKRHLDGCGCCRRRLAELELSEGLLRRLPVSILPLEWSPATHGRLARLASWSEEPDLPEPERWRAPALSVLSLVATVFVATAVGAWAPVLPETSPPFSLAYIAPDSVSLPNTWRPGQ